MSDSLQSHGLQPSGLLLCPQDFQARILVWVAISFFKGSSWPRNGNCVSCTGKQILYHWVTREARCYTHTHTHIYINQRFFMTTRMEKKIFWSSNWEMSKWWLFILYRMLRFTDNCLSWKKKIPLLCLEPSSWRLSAKTSTQVGGSWNWPRATDLSAYSQLLRYTHYFC